MTDELRKRLAEIARVTIVHWDGSCLAEQGCKFAPCACAEQIINAILADLSAQRLMLVPDDTEAALKAADKAMDVMWPHYERPEHGGSPGEWIVETMDHVSTLIKRIAALKAAEGKSDE